MLAVVLTVVLTVVLAACWSCANRVLRGATFTSRCFFPQSGVPEDPVTGSAHCTLAAYAALVTPLYVGGTSCASRHRAACAGMCGVCA